MAVECRQHLRSHRLPALNIVRAHKLAACGYVLRHRATSIQAAGSFGSSISGTREKARPVDAPMQEELTLQIHTILQHGASASRAG